MKQQQVKQFKSLGLKVVEIPVGSKGPIRNGWTKKAVKWKKLKGMLPDINAGVVHGLCGTCCFDIDDLSAAMGVPLLVEHIIGHGLEYGSGVDGRLKSLFILPPGIDPSVFRTHSLPNGAGQFRCGDNQDVLPGSVHPSGSVYSWLNGGNSATAIPELPAAIVSLMVAEYEAGQKAKKRGGKDSASGGAYPFIDVYNSWFMDEGVSLLDAVYALGGYEYAGFNTLRRVGSTNKHSVVVYNDSDGIDRAYNFSDTKGAGLLAVGLHDPYSVLSLSMGFDEARTYVTKDHPELKRLVDNRMGVDSSDAVIGSDSGVVKKLLFDGIKFDKTKKNQPYFDKSVLFPKDSDGSSSVFASLVSSILHHQEGVYNPDMAFWYSLIFADYLIGTGYRSVGGASCEPLYVFTAGKSGDGKTTTMKSGGLHISELGGGGNSLDIPGVAGAVIDGAAGSFEKTAEDLPKISTAFKNKKHLKNVKTAEGLEDMLTSDAPFELGGLDHGCDVLFTQDEYGLKEGGTIDASSRLFRSTILDYKTLSRFDHVEPRLLAKSSAADKKAVKTRRYCVHFNYFTTATVETLRGVIRDSEVGQGYIQRFIGGCSRSEWFSTRYTALGSRGYNKVAIPKKLLKRLRKVMAVSNSVSGMARVQGGIPVGITDEADNYLNELLEVCMMDDSGDSELISKMVENIQPIAKLSAVLRSPDAPVVSLEDVRWAHTICSGSALYFKWLLDELRSDIVDVGLTIEKGIRLFLSATPTARVGGTKASIKAGLNLWTRRELVQKCNLSRYGAAKYNPVLEDLVVDGTIEFVEVIVSSGQKKKCIRVIE